MSEPAKRSIGRPFQKGVSGNPNGRPRNEIGELVRRHLAGFETISSGEKVQRGTLLVQKLYHQAVAEGNIAACKELLDRAYGKAVQAVEVDVDATRHEVERLARDYGKSLEQVEKDAEQHGMRLVK